jgi:hypothetical protein
VHLKFTLLGLWAALAFTLVAGCEKSGSQPAVSLTPTPLSPDTIVRVHWLGKNELGNRAGAFYFMRVWDLPSSAQLEAQTLTRFSTAPGHRLLGENGITNQIGAWLYPLLADAVWNESWLEVREAAHQPAETVWAIRLDTPHARLWETNLAAVVESLTGARPVAAPAGFGWSLEKQGPPAHVTLTRVGQWTLVSAGPDPNDLLNEVTARIQRDHTPYVSQTTDDWLEADADLPRLAAWLPQDWNLPAGLPQISVAVAGDGANVLTHGRLTFHGPLPLEIAPWTPPAGLIQEPLDSFTAIRGLQPWLSSLKMWHALPLEAPRQLYFWSIPGAPSQDYFAATLPDASNQVNRLTAHLMEESNPWLAARGYVKFEYLPDSSGVSWGNLPSIQPFFKFADAGSGLVFGGLLPDTTPGTNTQDNLYPRPSLSGLLGRISGETNLVYYDWELTGSRIEPCLYLGQVARVISRHAQLPEETVSVGWLRAIEPRLGSSTTTIICTGTNQLSFFRKSTVGFTGAELQLLADWLESPQFPSGLYSLSTP